jgi:osmotically-inducible protein OsmY
MKTTTYLALISGLIITQTIGAAPAASGGAGGTAAAGANGAIVGGTASGRIVGPVPPNQTVSGTAFQGAQTATDTITTNPMSPATNQSATMTNSLQSTNNMSTAGNSNGNNSVVVSQAVTASDRVLLNSLTQSVGVQLGINSQAQMPVHFLINNGAVTLIGTVATPDVSQRIAARVQQTPGVLSVFNDLSLGTAAQTTTPQTGFFTATQDHAFSPADQSILSGVQQAAAMQLGISGASAAQLPVHFSIQNGVVGVTGRVSSLREKQTLIAAIQRASGVVRVVDNVAIANPAAGGVSGPAGNQNPFLNNSNLPLTSRDQNQSNIYLNTTNSSGL